MSVPPGDMPPVPPAPCRGARWLLTVAAAMAVLAVLAIGTGRLLAGRQPAAQTAAWMQAFSLSRPALWPAGTPPRHPETVHPGVAPEDCAGLESRR